MLNTVAEMKIQEIERNSLVYDQKNTGMNRTEIEKIFLNYLERFMIKQQSKSTQSNKEVFFPSIVAQLSTIKYILRKEFSDKESDYSQEAFEHYSRKRGQAILWYMPADDYEHLSDFLEYIILSHRIVFHEEFGYSSRVKVLEENLNIYEKDLAGMMVKYFWNG